MTLTQMIEEGRLQHVIIPEQVLQTILGNWSDAESLVLPTFPDLPKGCVLTRVYYDPSRRGFLLEVAHEIFGKTAQGCLIRETDQYSRVVWNRLAEKFERMTES